MRFELTSDQSDFAAALDALVAGSDPVGVARAWADGDTAPGLKLWRRIAEQGVNALLVDEDAGGMGATPVELVVALEVLGRHAVPGPWVESAAYLPVALADADLLGRVAEGAVGTAAAAPVAPYALDADVASVVVSADGETLWSATAGERQRASVDRTRRLFTAEVGEALAATDLAGALDMAALATAAQLLGAGERVLADSVGYAKQRRQFGREIGSYQAIKHRLADVRIALDFARPLVFGAALDPTPRAVSAAKVMAADAAYLSSRTGLQVHGAIGYTQEFDLSIWLTKIRALVGAWGTPAFHRARILDTLTGAQ
ncbi:acyl-CoA dehydrogenase family protein [Nocardioides sp. SYSU DS0651]|uniref:acyl-CoA dehydrogenase family protein n=1 Tax=Nocardioides sp. SYSU DS0651 TaxID=3415955 RepID=UPI003F4C5888